MTHQKRLTLPCSTNKLIRGSQTSPHSASFSFHSSDYIILTVWLDYFNTLNQLRKGHTQTPLLMLLLSNQKKTHQKTGLISTGLTPPNFGFTRPIYKHPSSYGSNKCWIKTRI